MRHASASFVTALATVLILTGCAGADPEPQSDVASIEMGEPQSDATAPAAQLSFGEVGWFEAPQGPDDSPGLVGLAVLELEQQDAATFWDEQFGSDADEFAGLTPYTVVTQTDFTANPVPESYYPNEPQVVGVYPDGTFSQYAVTSGGGYGNDCGLTLPEWDVYDEEQTTLLSCYVLGAVEGQTITSLAYTGATLTQLSTGSGPYWEQPVTWTP